MNNSAETNSVEIVSLTQLALVYIEVSEAREEIRNIDKEKMAKELAGLCIRIMYLAENQGIDLEKHILWKTKETRQDRLYITVSCFEAGRSCR